MQKLIKEIEPYKRIFVWLEKSFSGIKIEDKEAIRYFLCRQLVRDLSEAWDINIELNTGDFQFIHRFIEKKIYNFYGVSDVYPVNYTSDYLEISVVMESVGEGWVHLFQEDSRTTIEILHLLYRFYKYSYRKIISEVCKIFNDGHMLSATIKPNMCYYSQSRTELSKIQRMKLFFEKYIDFTDRMVKVE